MTHLFLEQIMKLMTDLDGIVSDYNIKVALAAKFMNQNKWTLIVL